MAHVTTGDIMTQALGLAGMAGVPCDSGIQIPRDRVGKLLMCIDCTTAEVLLAHQLGCDTVLVHHPFGGRSRVWSHRYYQRHVDLMVAAGVPTEAAREAVESRIQSLSLTGQSANYDQVVAAAEILGLGLLNIHAPADEIGRRVMQECCDRVTRAGHRATVADIVAALSAIPELAAAMTEVTVVVGSPGNRAGHVMVAHGALTNGGYDVARACFAHGIGTVVYIHIDAASARSLDRDGEGNLVVTGHIASDWIGINPLLRHLRRMGLEVVALSELAAAP